MNTQDKLNARAWNNYWETGFKSTFTGHEESGFFHELDDTWMAEFSQLANDSAVVDLGAGNGALTTLALKAGAQDNKNLSVTAIDYAAVKNASELFSEKHDNLTVKDNTPIENTGLDSASIDLCVSQFGFEYANHEEAANEVNRILKPGGKLIAVVHHRQSEITQSCASAHMQIGLCHRTQLTQITEKLLRRLRKLSKSNRSPQQDEIAENLRNEMNHHCKCMFFGGELTK